ncbi:hypothetical protein LZ30DRAFT_242914 [Colletotrichum cereale]|nr:hypothetical protein LZ30DRAFT_242914 [Colletotrichum cereale]
MLLFGGFFGTLATLASLECFLRGVAGQVAGQCPLLERDTSTCPATTDLQELDCIASETTMKELIDCVRIDHQQEEKLCRSTLPGSEDDYYRESDWIKALGGVRNGAYCVTPGRVLVSGSRPARCAKCQLLGLFQSCPQGHPQYHRCLCARRASRKHFQSCLDCFKVDSASKDLNDLDCNSLGRRDVMAGDEKELESTVLKSRNEPIAYYEVRQRSRKILVTVSQILICTVYSYPRQVTTLSSTNTTMDGRTTRAPLAHSETRTSPTR